MRKGKFGISLMSNMLAMVVSLGVSFFLTPYLISHLGKEAYSFFPLANNFVNYMTIVSIALNSMASRFITISMVSGNVEKSKGYFSSVFFANVFLCGILLIPMIFIVCSLNRFLDIPTGLEGEIKLLFSLVFGSLLIQLISSVFGVATFAKERMDLYAYQNIGYNVIRAVLYIILFRMFPSSIVIMGIVTMILTIYNGFVQLCYSKRLMPEYKIAKNYYNKSYVVELISSGGWNSLNNIGISLMQTMMLLLANVMISVSASADLSIVQTLPNLITTIISTVFGVLLPRIANVYAMGDKKTTIDKTMQSQKIMSAISVVPVIIIILMGKHFYSLWIPGEDVEKLQLLSIVTVVPLLIHGSMWMFYGLNVMNNRVKQPAIFFLIAGVINILLTIIVLKTTSVGLIAVPLISGMINIAYYTLYIPGYASKEMGVSGKVIYMHIFKSVTFGIVVFFLGMPICSRLEIRTWGEFFIYSGIVAVILEFIYIAIIFDKTEKKKGLSILLKNNKIVNGE